MPIDDDSPVELLWQNLRDSELWQQLERALLERRDRMVAAMVSDRPKASDDPGMAYAAHQRKLGYIEALNAVVAAPGREQEKVAQARKTA